MRRPIILLPAAAAYAHVPRADPLVAARRAKKVALSSVIDSVDDAIGVSLLAIALGTQPAPVAAATG